jgi:flagellar biosynthesis/type III secretory pathway chaperone
MSMARHDVQKLLSGILAEEGQLLLELHRVLEQETDVVSGEDADAIARIGTNRHRCVNRLAQLAAERSDTGRMLSFGSDGAGLARLFDWADPDAMLHAKWNANLELARRCRSINEKNGAVVAAKLDRVQKLLGKLRGVAPPPVYSAKGSRYGNLGARDFGLA